ncbi:hypothetical protein C1H46_022239 [Malus baccata]|uniref:Uncharacterized protein n=1 Tax=Malus baccata TaxID=106549 RepID=A0A540M0A1_MALBA|nr:hypothetical protein C1H46_022239 [Malus baccata]
MLRYIKKVCKVQEFTPARVLTPPYSLGLLSLAVSQMGFSLASLIFSTWWLQSEKVSLLDDGAFLPSFLPL